MRIYLLRVCPTAWNPLPFPTVCLMSLEILYITVLLSVYAHFVVLGLVICKLIVQLVHQQTYFGGKEISGTKNVGLTKIQLSCEPSLWHWPSTQPSISYTRHPNGRVLWTYMGWNKMLSPSMSLPVKGETAGVNTASQGGWLHSSKTRARWAEGFHNKLKGNVFDLEGCAPSDCTLPFSHHENKTSNHTKLDQLPPWLTRTTPSVVHQVGGVKYATGASSKICGRDITSGTWNTRTLTAAGKLQELSY